MNENLIVVIIIIVANIFISYKGFKELSFLERNKFEVDSILIHKEYHRLIVSGFLHLDWIHLLFNMITLYSFAEIFSNFAGVGPFLIIYFGSLIGGNLFALFIHREHGNYSAVGASGAVCGVLFASVASIPEMELSLFILPIFVPAWIFGILFVAISLYGIKSKKDNIGHEAHLGGALCGMIIAIAFNPGVIVENYLPILIVTVPTILFTAVIIYKPGFLLIDSNFLGTDKRHYSFEHKYNDRKVTQQREIDLILEKISRKGLESLSKGEKEKLEEYSKY